MRLRNKNEANKAFKNNFFLDSGILDLTASSKHDSCVEIRSYPFRDTLNKNILKAKI